MTTYERIRVRPDDGSAPFTVILRDVVERGYLLTGVEVDREGDDVEPRGADERRHIISTPLITKRTPLVMDRLTATLVKPGEQMTETPGGTA